MSTYSYDVAQICLNGHVANSSYLEYPQHNETYCTKCGQPTITKCPKCDVEIRGYYSGAIIGSSYKKPYHCHNCGNPYPWTKLKLESAKELIFEDENLTVEDKEKLNSTLPDLISQTPKSQLAATRFKKLTTKCLTVTGDALKQILIEISTETVKKTLGV